MPKIKEKYVLWEELEAILGGATWAPSTDIDAGQVGGLTPGSIPIVDASGFLTEDNPNLFWDSAEKNFGIGTATFSADMTQGIQVATGAAPTGNVADTFAFYSADFAAGNACPHFRTENGTVIGLNQSLFTTDNVIFGTIGCGAITVANGSSINLQEDITFTGATAQNLVKFPDNLPTALDFREGATSYLLFRTSDGTESVTIGKPLTLSSIVAGVADYDKFLASDSGVVKYRTGAQVLSDIGGGDVAAASNIGDNKVVRGDGGAKGVQESDVTIDDDGNVGINSISFGNGEKVIAIANATIVPGPDSYTKLLLHCNGADASTTFTDNGNTGHTPVAAADAQLDTAQKKFGTASGLFDGTGDYVSVPDHADWNFGTGDFTIDFWLRANSFADDDGLVCRRNDATHRWLFYFTGTTAIHFFASNGVGGLDFQGAHGMSTGTWYHVALVRHGNEWDIYINGTSVGNTTDADGLHSEASALLIGKRPDPTANSFDGWLDEIRISKGIARWTGDFSGSLPTGEYGGSPSGGGVLFCQSGILKYLGSSGTVTTLGAA